MGDPVTPTPTPTPAHPILAELWASLGPVLMQFLAAYLAKLTPAQAAELHTACCAQAKGA